MYKRYYVNLAAHELEQLHALLRAGDASPRVLDRARVLLEAHAGRSDVAIAASVRVGTTTVCRLRRRFAAEGLAATLYDRPRPGGRPKLARAQVAMVHAIHRSAPPNGRRKWSMQQLADALVARGAVETISSKTVRRALAKRGR